MPQESDILPANFAINSKIRALREQWECNVTSCKSDFCFIPAEGPHFPLGHGHFEKWAAAIVCFHPNIHIYCSYFIHSSSVATIWPAWKSRRISSFLIQSHLTQPYRSRLCYKLASTRSAKKKLCLCHKQLRSSTSCYRMTCSIPTNTLDRLRQHHK